MSAGTVVSVLVGLVAPVEFAIELVPVVATAPGLELAVVELVLMLVASELAATVLALELELVALGGAIFECGDHFRSS